MPKYTHSAFYERGSLRSWCFISSAWNVKITLSTLNDMTRKLQPLWWNGNNDMLRGWECSEENNNETVFLNLLLRPHQPGCRCHLPSRNLWQTPNRRTPELLKWKTSMIWGFKHHKNSNFAIFDEVKLCLLLLIWLKSSSWNLCQNQIVSGWERRLSVDFFGTAKCIYLVCVP